MVDHPRSIESSTNPEELELSGSSLGGSQSQQPEILDDSGRSTQKAFLVEAVCDGKARIIDGLKGVYFDRTPVESPNGNRNFTGFSFRARLGVPFQEPLRDVGQETVADYPVNVLVKHEPGASIDQTRITRTAINSQLTSIRVTLQVQMYRENGTKGDEMQFKIWGKRGTDPWKVRLDRTIKGKFGSPIGLEYDIQFVNSGGNVDTFSVRVEKVTPDPDPDDDDDDGRLNALKWTNYAEVIKQPQSYANTAVVALELNPEQFQSIPERRYLVERLDVRIPSNASVTGRGRLTFSGNWDGTFKVPNEGIADPAWILLDMFTNTRYGFGHPISKINIWKLYELSQYNNQLVPDGFGGNHARYAIRTQIQTAEEEDRMLDLICSAMNAKKYRSNGQLTFWQDRPTTPTWNFTNADVEDGKFVYSSTGVASRFTALTVAWNDPDDFWRLSYETVDDQAGVNRYGYQKSDIVAYGCNERGRAIRMGRWGLFSNLNETELVNFRPRAFGALVELGEVIRIQDNNFYTLRYGGLVKEANASQIQLDYPVTLTGNQVQLTCLMPSGNYETRDVGSRGAVQSVEVVPPFSQAPLPETSWIITTPDRPPTLWRVINKIPMENDPTKVELQCVIHFPEKYSYIERKVSLTTPTPPPVIPVTVEPVPAVESTYIAGPPARLVANVTFNPANPYVKSAIVQYTTDGIVFDNSRTVTASAPFAEYPNPLPGVYRFRCVATDIGGKQSGYTYSVGTTTVPIV